MGRQGAHRKRPQDPGPGPRPHGPASRISHRHQGSVGSALWQSHHAGNAPAQADLVAHQLSHSRERALVRRGRRASLRRGTTLRLAARLARRRPFPHVGAAELSLEPDGFRVECPGGRGDSVARELCRNRAVVRLRGDLRRYQRQCRKTAAASGWKIPAAHGAQLRRDRFPEAARRETRSQAHHRAHAPISPRRSRTRKVRNAAPASLATCAFAAVLSAATSAAFRRRCPRPNAPAT